MIVAKSVTERLPRDQHQAGCQRSREMRGSFGSQYAAGVQGWATRARPLWRLGKALASRAKPTSEAKDRASDQGRKKPRGGKAGGVRGPGRGV